MSYSNGKLPGLDIELIQGYIEPVYRYHLARCENYLEAQNLTAETLSTVMKWIDTYRSGHDNLKTWVMGIAHDRQSFGRRHAPMAVKSLAGASSSTSSSLSSDHEPLPPEQGEILRRDRMSHLSSSWKHLPARQADALALHYFGGLSLAEVGTVLHKTESIVRALIAHETTFEAELLELAASIHPGKDLISRLQDELSQPGPRQRSWLPHWLKPDIWRSSYSAWRRFFRMGARLSQTGLLVGILVLGFYMIQRQGVVPSGPPATPTSLPLLGKGVAGRPEPAFLPPAPLDNPGSLVPPAAGVCQEWQAALANEVGQQDVTISNSAFNDPTQTSTTQPDSSTKGTGCLLETTVVNWDLHSAWSTFDYVSELLLAKNFNQHGDAGYPGYGDTDYFDPGCYGLGRTFGNSDSRAILTVSWCTPNESITGTGTPNPTNSGSGSNIFLDLGGGVPLSGGLRPYILKLILASNDLDSFLNGFFGQWSAGSQQITTYLAPSLLSRFLNLKALDRLAGINLLSGQRVSFSWQVLDNSGSNLRILVQVYESTGQKIPANLKTEFQMAVAQDNGAWTIQELGKTVQFSS